MYILLHIWYFFESRAEQIMLQIFHIMLFFDSHEHNPICLGILPIILPTMLWILPKFQHEIRYT